MTRAWKMALFLALVLLLGWSVSLGWSAPQTNKLLSFSTQDRELIQTYYRQLSGSLAPGSIDRSTFGVAVERSLVAGQRVPVHLQKELAPLPRKLESQLSMTTSEYSRYRLGHHIVLVKRDDFTIADILKSVAPK